MTQSNALYSDNEFFIMEEIIYNEKVSQRELSRKLGLSLGTINVLINKMIKDGKIKMNQVSQRQVMYMLTPTGIIEKSKKTLSYLKSHYRAIYETKEKIKLILNELNSEYKNIIIFKSNDEMGDLIELAITEYKSINKFDKMEIIDESFDLDKYKNIANSVVLYLIENEEIISKLLKMNCNINNVRVVNLFEML